jgi:hypothetical protein
MSLELSGLEDAAITNVLTEWVSSVKQDIPRKPQSVGTPVQQTQQSSVEVTTVR